MRGVILCAAVSCLACAPAVAQERDTRVFGFAPTMGVFVEEVEVRTVANGSIPTFVVDAGLPRLAGPAAVSQLSWEGGWSTVVRGSIEVRYANDDDMDHFENYFFLNGQRVTPGYPVMAVSIDADGRVWAAVHAASSPDHRYRHGWMIYSSSGEYLFSLESPSRETFHDAIGDLVAFVRNNHRTTIDVAVRRLSNDRDAEVIW